MNFITFMDSKPVSFLSTAAGVTPLHNIRRFSVKNRSKVDLVVPKIVKQYNDFKGGVDQHDAHCSNLFPRIRAKKWTWSILLRLIQSSISNATVLRNLVHANKLGTKQIALELAEHYLAKSKFKKVHEIVNVVTKRNCNNFKNVTKEHKKCAKVVMCICVYPAFLFFTSNYNMSYIFIENFVIAIMKPVV